MTVPSLPRRPVFLDPLKIRLPVTAIVSLAHRISGLLLALALPFLVCALSLSLRDAEGYARVQSWLAGLPVRLVLLVLAWGLAHHTANGVRHMLFDAGVGTAWPAARRSAWAVHAFALLVVLLAAGALL